MNQRDDARLEELFRRGFSIRDISSALNVGHPGSVRDRLKKLNLKRPWHWHRRWAACQSCGSTHFAHDSGGYCLKCTGKLTFSADASCGFCGSACDLVSRAAQHCHGVIRHYPACRSCARQADRQVNLLAWCGRTRRRIPAAEQWASRPLARDGNAPGARVAVLGATGFVGRNLCDYLADQFTVIPASRSDCDAMSEASVRRFLRRKRPQVLVNLAAFVGGIGLNKDNPGDMIYRNLVMSTNVVNACYTMGVRKLVYLGSVCCFPHTPAHIPFVEDDLWNGRPEPTNEPYGVAKKTVGLLLDAYKRQFNFSSAYLIPTNMYGPHDDFSLYASHVVPAMIRKFLAAKRDGGPVTLWGDGSPSRDFLYVGDCCAAIKLAIEQQDEPLPINVGSGVETTMRALAATIARLTDYQGDIKWDASRPNGQPRRCLDVSRARQILRFQAGTNLEDGLKETIAWYQHSMGD